MDSTMNSLPTQAILGAGTAVLAAIVAATLGTLPLAVGLVSAAVMAAVAYVAFMAQSQRFRDEERLVYRPVYVRRQGVQHRVRSDD
jgi:uncharacterized membrane protein